MNKFMLFAKTCQSYRLWLTTELSLSRLWFFTLIVEIFCIGTLYLFIHLGGQYSWLAIMIILECSAGAVLGAALYISISRGIKAAEKHLPWFLPTVALCFFTIIPALMIKDKGFAYFWADFWSKVLQPMGYFTAGAVTFAIVVNLIIALIKRFRCKREKV